MMGILGPVPVGSSELIMMGRGYLTPRLEKGYAKRFACWLRTESRRRNSKFGFGAYAGKFWGLAGLDQIFSRWFLRAMVTASDRFAAPSLEKIRLIWSFTLATLMPNCLAMSGFVSPRVID